MGIFTRFSDIVNSNINAILDKAEDPEKIVRLMIQEMEDTLVEVRSAAARSIADKKDLNRKLETLDREVNDWADKAELAMRKAREDLAKAALVEKSRAKGAADVIKADYLAVDEGLGKLNEDIARLEGGGVIGQNVLEEIQGPGATNNESAHMGDIKKAGSLTSLEVLLDDSARIVQRHLPAGKVHHLCTEAGVPVIQDGFA